MSLALPVGMKSMQTLISSVSPDITVCVRGGHAKGKSEGVHQAAELCHDDFYLDPANCARMVEELKNEPAIAKRLAKSGGVWTHDMGLPVVERRLSQMTEGDTIGLPKMEGRYTSFKPCDWLIYSCDFPVLLFLDERNRALEQVKQSVFQLADSKAFYGNRLHDGTRIVIAENIGDAYTVNQSDPAEISRAATVMLETTVEEWIEYARKICNPATVEFIINSPKSLEHNGNFEANKKYPDRRSWVKLDKELTRLGLFDNPHEHMLYVLAGAFLGAETAGAFHKFCKERERHVNAKDILMDWTKAKTRLGSQISNEQFIELAHKLSEWLVKGQLDDKQADQLALYMKDCPPEPRLMVWVGSQKNYKNLVKLHPRVEQLIVATATGTDTTNINVVTGLKSKADKEESDSSTSDAKTRTRGARK